MGHGNVDAGDATPRSTAYERGFFGRLFPTLPAFAADTPTLREALKDIGRPGGLMDPLDDLTDPVALLTDPAKRAHNPDNPVMTAGFTFLGQFLDHDMTFDPTSSLARQQDPESLENYRVPSFGLDSVYGQGPGASPHLYDQSVDGGQTTLLVEEIPGSCDVSADGSTRFDVPRNRQGTALLGDPRNDENLIVSQLQLAFLRFHDAVVQDVRADLGASASAREVFGEAQRIVRWHYQWIILHQFLPTTVGPDVVDDVVANGRKFYRWRNDPYIPVEFSVGAYRFGHSQVRPSYRANFGTDATSAPAQFVGLIFDASLPAGDPDPGDLRGGRRAPRRFVDWQTFFDFGDGRSKPNKRIDTKLSSPLFQLLGQPAGEPTSLAQRNLLRSLMLSVPSGQRVARAMRLPELAPADLKDLDGYGLDKRTPLWFYVLREADVVADGQHLGPVGGRIVAEVMIGQLEGDKLSYLNQDPDWTPTYGTDDTFTVADLLRAAGVVATLDH